MQTQSSTQDVMSTSKLTARMAANRQASRDFDEWCIRQLPELPMPSRVLDLGCGTGKQLHLFSPLLSPQSEIWGMDLSEKSLLELETNYRGAAQLKIRAGSFDEAESFADMEKGSFDLIYGSYALYYTKNLTALIKKVFQLLKPGGVFWNVSPYFGTNDEFLRIIRPLHEVEPFMDYVFDEFHQDILRLGETEGFSSSKASLLRNAVSFPTAEAFLTYLSNSLFYREGHDEAILSAVNQVVQSDGQFRVSKNVISLQLRK
ncbi:MAG: class I SAM-dependent methyltransferase [Bacteroidota bacterium]